MMKNSRRRCSLPPTPRLHPPNTLTHRNLPSVTSRPSQIFLLNNGPNTDFNSLGIIEKALSNPSMLNHSPLKGSSCMTLHDKYTSQITDSQASINLIQLKNTSDSTRCFNPLKNGTDSRVPSSKGLTTKQYVRKPPPEKRFLRRSNKSDLSYRFQRQSDHSNESTPSRG